MGAVSCLCESFQVPYGGTRQALMIRELTTELPRSRLPACGSVRGREVRVVGSVFAALSRSLAESFVARDGNLTFKRPNATKTMCLACARPGRSLRRARR